MKRIFSKLHALILAAISAIANVLALVIPRYMNQTGLLLTLDEIPTAADFNRYRVTDPNQSEVVRQRLYDFQLYPAAGQQQFSFFNQGVGSGKTSTSGAVAGSAA